LVGCLWPLDWQDFLDALAGCVDVEDDLSRAICEAFALFLWGNETDDYSGTEQDIVWLVAALKQLFRVASGAVDCTRGVQLHIAISKLLGK
jgi:hypothetical protein